MHISWPRSLERLPGSSIGTEEGDEQRVGFFSICEHFCFHSWWSVMRPTADSRESKRYWNTLFSKERDTLLKFKCAGLE
jgi:hypothetical protein